MQVEFMCECGQAMRADVGPGTGTVQCPACGQMLTVGVPPPTAYAPPERRPASGKAVAALVFGLCGFIPGIGLLCGPVGIGLGIAVLTKKLQGKGFGIAGIATGGVGLIGQAFLGLWIYMMVMLFTGMTRAMMTMPTTAPAVVAAQTMADADIERALVLEFSRPVNEKAAKAELAEAKRLLARLGEEPGNAYRSLEHFALHLAHRGTEEFEDPEDAKTCELLRANLAAKIRRKLDEAERFQQRARWQKAEDAYGEVMELVPDADNMIHTSAASSRQTCRMYRRMQEGAAVVEEEQ
ncbi:MAG: DUF4190 domain-containing protein [Phycisphaerae bacterium]